MTDSKARVLSGFPNEVQVDTITDSAGTGSPDFPNGVDAGVLTGDVAVARITNALNATGSAPLYACRAWVNFDGTGTVSIRESGNVSSITDNGTGHFSINYSNSMVDANYCLNYTAQSSLNGSVTIASIYGSTTNNQLTTTSAKILTATSGGSATDPEVACVSVIR